MTAPPLAPGPLAKMLVPLALSAQTDDDVALVDLSSGVRVVWDDARCAGVGSHLQADLDRLLGDPDRGAHELHLAMAEDAMAPQELSESYRLHLADRSSSLRAPTSAGLARGTATVRQLIDVKARAAVPITVDDAPRFTWRGLLVDCVRHFMPLDALRRTIDGMALAKLNVLHLHLTDDQAWRVESRAFPDLVRVSAPGGHYTLDELATLVAHAADRGVRIVPELDVPGHTAALLVARPDLALGTPPVAVPTEFVVPNVSLDHRNDAVYEVLDTIIGEWASVFPDPYLHIGGDEVPVLGEENQAVFTARMVELLRAHGRTAVVWDEALHPSLARDVVVQAWRCPAKLHEAVRAGHRAILSSGWYLDLGVPLPMFHAIDPLAEPQILEAMVAAPWTDRELSGAVGGVAAATLVEPGTLVGAEPLTAAQQALVLGGEACMWCERVTPTLLDTYLWPIAAAVSDRLWSTADALDSLGPTFAEARLDLLPAFRVWTDIDVRRGPREVLAGLASLVEAESVMGAAQAELALAGLADWCEPVRWYARAAPGWVDANGRSDDAPLPGTGQPLDRFVDALVPECAGARAWRRSPGGDAEGNAFAAVGRWRSLATSLAPLLEGSSKLAEPARLAARLSDAADALVDVLEGRLRGDALDARLRELHAPIGEATVAVHPVFRAVAAEAVR